MSSPRRAVESLLLCVISAAWVCGCAAGAAQAQATQPQGAAGGAMFKGGPAHVGVVDSDLKPPLKLRWKFPGTHPFNGSPTVFDGVVYCGSDDGVMYALDARDGKVRWRFATGGEVEGAPAVALGRLYFGSFDGWFYCVNKDDGALVWKFQTGPASKMAQESSYHVKTGQDAAPAVVGGVVYMGGWDGKIYALKADDGAKVWEYQTQGSIHYSGPAVVDGRLYIGSTDGVFHCLSTRDGAVIYTRQLVRPHIDHMMSAPTVVDGVVYVGGGWEGSVFALDADSGKEKWKYMTETLVAGSPTVYKGKVYVFTDTHGMLHAIDAGSGARVWRTNFGRGWGGCSPIVSNGYVWLTMREGTVDGQPAGLAVVEAQSGKVMWHLGEGRVFGTPAIAEGALFFGSGPGGVYALENAGGP